MTAKPRWGRSDYGQVYHLVGGSYWDTTYARCGPVLTYKVPADYTPTESGACGAGSWRR